ncbi:uroporphyrinogen decarboxylase family protein [Methanomassiliicoccus luminyensis]|uniref:uroporphyrinogen decarboxylase family protein n=1 Tax=Methanomassiliicoccus luminyensis TaxID=1080712 RepID=UPI0004749A89|nr:uroporphyrinogen decarboxylase family protein [Methanomassiliicoccus luminyensis]
MFREKMTPKERINSLHETGRADRPGISVLAMGLVPRMTGVLTIGECYEDPIKYARAFLRVQELFGFDSGPVFGHPACGAAEFGGKLLYPRANSKMQSPVIAKHPLTKLEDIDRLEVPDPAKAGEIPRLVAGAKYVLDNYPDGYRNPMLVSGDPFTWAGNIIGMDTMLMWIEQDPALVAKALDIVAEFEIEVVKYALRELGEVTFFDGAVCCSNDLINAKRFKQLALPPLVKYRVESIKAGAERFVSHPCGDQSKNIDFWGQVPGTYTINFDFRTPLELCVSKLDKEMTIAGNIECMHFLIGDYDWIYRKSYDKLKFAATRCRRGYLVGPGCEIPPNSSPVNIHALVSAARDYAANDPDWKAMGAR